MSPACVASKTPMRVPITAVIQAIFQRRHKVSKKDECSLKPKNSIYYCLARDLVKANTRRILCDVDTTCQESHYVFVSPPRKSYEKHSSLLCFILQMSLYCIQYHDACVFLNPFIRTKVLITRKSTLPISIV